MKNIPDIVHLLAQYHFAAASEAELHQAVAQALRESAVPFEPEWPLSARDRIDFYCRESLLGIECKIDGSPSQVMRQLLRYAESGAIQALVLVTTRNKHRAIPQTLGGKPVYVVLTRAF
jgi:hypothetical protein